MVGVIWYRFVRCGGTDWSDTLVPIHPLQWYRFADIISIATTDILVLFISTFSPVGDWRISC